MAQRNALRRHLQNMATAFERIGPARRVECVRLDLRIPADDPDTRGLRPGVLIPEGAPFESAYTAAEVGQEAADGTVLVTLTWRRALL